MTRTELVHGLMAAVEALAEDTETPSNLLVQANGWRQRLEDLDNCCCAESQCTDCPAFHTDYAEAPKQPDEAGHGRIGAAMKGHQAACGEYAWMSARHSLLAGLTRSQFMTFIGFIWGQAASDHAHAEVAEALSDAAKGSGA